MAITQLSPLPALSIDAYASNVAIFRSTRAVDVPDKLNAIGNDFKSWLNNNVMDATTDYINQSMTTIVNYVNTSMSGIDDDLTDYKDNLNSEWSTYKDDLTGEWSTFKGDLETNLSSYLDSSGAGYSIAQINQLIFSGDAIDPVYDSEGRITKYGNQYEETFDITYDSDNRISGFKEKITIGGVTTTETYTVAYNGNDYPITTKV